MFNKDDMKLLETWFYYDGPQVGVLEDENKKQYYFSSYADCSLGGPLFLFSQVDENVLNDVRDGKREVLSAYSDNSAILYRDIELADGTIITEECDFAELMPDELPEPGVFLKN